MMGEVSAPGWPWACGASNTGLASAGSCFSPAPHARPTTISVATPSPSARPLILFISFFFCRVISLTGLLCIDARELRKVPATLGSHCRNARLRPLLERVLGRRETLKVWGLRGAVANLRSPSRLCDHRQSARRARSSASRLRASRTTAHAPSTVQRRLALKCANLPVRLLLLIRFPLYVRLALCGRRPVFVFAYRLLVVGCYAASIGFRRPE